MAQEFKPGEIVPQSGIYTITHDPAHADLPHEVRGSRAGTFSPAGNLPNSLFRVRCVDEIEIAPLDQGEFGHKAREGIFRKGWVGLRPAARPRVRSGSSK